MPCYTRITQTKILKLDALLEALLSLKIAVKSQSATSVITAIGTFSRSSATAAFGFVGDDEQLKEVAHRYGAAVGKQIFKKYGMSVTNVAGRKVTMQTRG